MKNLLLLTFLLFGCISLMQAQTATPAGMRYQAIARDADGVIRAKESLTVKAELMVLDAAEKVVYEEIHQTTSGEFGLINITIGEGQPARGGFTEVPWDQHIWVRISIKHDE